MKADDAKELGRLKAEKARLKRLVADLTMENQMLKGWPGEILSPSQS